MTLVQNTHRRRNPLNGKWVLVSPKRNNRPWSGATENVSETALPSYDPSCPLCPGNTRANGQPNPQFDSTYVFANDFGALENTKKPAPVDGEEELMQAEVTDGECRVICYSPDHNRTLPELSHAEILSVVNTWQQHYLALAEQYSCVHIFENKGEVMGCSQPHPHGQIWAHNHWSSEIEQAQTHLLAYFEKHGTNLLADYLALEQKHQQRILIENHHWLAVVPYWAAWPFETLLIAKRDVRDFGDLQEDDKDALASILKTLTTKYDNIFNCSFPYSMGWHSAPCDLDDSRHWRLHAHFYPPLLRSPSVKKHMVGYEMLAESQRDITPETAAQILQEASNIHYKTKRLGDAE